MKRILSRLFSLIEILINSLLLFIFDKKIFHEIAVRPVESLDGSFTTVRRDFYYSIIDNLKYDSMQLVNFSAALLIASIITSGVSLVFNTKIMTRISHTVFFISFFVFASVFYLASMVKRDY
jgi:hypothetical protein